MRITKTKRNQLKLNDIVAFYGENEYSDVLYLGRITQFDQFAVLIVKLEGDSMSATISRDKFVQFWVNFWELVAVDLDSIESYKVDQHTTGYRIVEQPIPELDEAATVGYFNL